MKKTVIVGLFITSLVIANVVAGKVLMIGSLVLPGAVLLYAVTFLMTDLMSELFGKKEANRLVLTGFICAVFASAMIFLTKLLPSAPFALEAGAAYDVLLGSNIRYVIASMVAYFVSQSWDVWFFHLIGKKTKGKHKWLRNNLSTMTSQALDTSIYITIAFIGNVPNIGVMILSQYIVKLIIAAVDTPVFYIITRNIVNKEFTKDADIKNKMENRGMVSHN